MELAPLKQLVEDLLSGDRARVRAAVDAHVARDVRFSHLFGTARGREAFYGIYRLCGAAWDYKIGWGDYIRAADGRTVVLLLDLGIKVPPFYLLRYHFPTLILLRFEEEEEEEPEEGGGGGGDEAKGGGKASGGAGGGKKLRLVSQSDHHSALALLWLLGWPFTAWSELCMRPLSGWALSRAGLALDAADGARAALGRWLRGWAAAVPKVDGGFTPERVAAALGAAGGHR